MREQTDLALAGRRHGAGLLLGLVREQAVLGDGVLVLAEVHHQVLVRQLLQHLFKSFLGFMVQVSLGFGVVGF